jgi:hypothetical protein
MSDMEENNFVFNKYQTALTDNILKTLDSSSQSELFDCITKIELIKNLSNKDRKYAKDLERINGKIVVNLENPHILENMQYFKPAARHFQQFGCYTKLFENPDPDSDYMKFWTEERRRCLEGYVRESDGEWIPGYLYHYWNYGRVKVKIKTSAKTAIEKEDFPNVYDSDYWYFHYIDQAQSNGLFGFSLKKRRWGYSYKLQNMMCRNYVHIKGSKSFVLASGKEYIYRDGPMPKFKQNLSFIEENTPFWSPRLIDTMEHTKSGYKDKKLGIEKGRFSEVMGVTCKDDPDKGRGKAGVLVAFEEVGIFPQLEKTWTVAEESVRQDDLVYGFLNGSGTGGSDGSNFESAEKMFYSPEGYNIKPMRNIYSKTNGVGICSFFVPTYVSFEGAYDENGNSDVIKAMVSLLEERQKIKNSTHDSNRLLQKKAEKPITPEEAVLRKEGSIFPILDIKEYLSTIYPNRQSFVSGHYTGNLVLKPDNSVVLEHVEGNTPIRKYPLNSESEKIGAIEIFELPKKVNHGDRYILGCLPKNEKVLTNRGLINVEDVTLLDKLINKEGDYVNIKNLQKYFVEDEDIYKIGVYNTFRKTSFTKEHPIYISNKKFGYVSYKKTKRLDIPQKYLKLDFNFVTAENVKVGDYIKVPNIYKKENNFDYSTFWNDNLYRIDRTIPNPLNTELFWWFVGLWLGDGWCENDNYSISIAFNKKEIHYIDKLKDVITKLFKRRFTERITENYVEIRFSFQQLNLFMTNTFGKYSHGKFIPEWVKMLPLNLKKELILGYLDSDGSVTKNNTIEFVSINLELLEAIQDILFSMNIISSLSKLRKAGLHKLRNKYCNTKETYRLRISLHNSIQLKELINCKEDIKLHKLNLNKKELRRFPKSKCFFSDDFKFIYFQISDIEKTSYTGTVYNYECDTNTFMCHHITTHNCDPIENDEVKYSVSLGSVFVFDRYTKRIVAEYTGRPNSVDEFFEICYRLAVFYNGKIMYENNKKGMYGYFLHVKNSVHLLADNPEYLKDTQSFKPKSVSGNTSKGFTSTVETKRHGRMLQSKWMMEIAYEAIPEMEYDDNGNPLPKKNEINLHKIRSIAYLEECSQWNPDGNFDRVDAMTCVMIYDQELGKVDENIYSQRSSKYADNQFLNKFKLRGNGIMSRFGYKVNSNYTG